MTTYTIDTNVFIENPYCIPDFLDGGQNHVVVPTAVIHELDGLKNAGGDKGFCARTASREIEKYQERGISVHRTEQQTGDAGVLEAVRSWGGSVLVTNDTNLRILARAESLRAEDYQKTRVKEVLWMGHRTIEIDDTWIMDLLHSDQPCVTSDHVESPIENEYYCFTYGTRSVIAVNKKGVLHKVHSSGAYGLTPRNLEQRFALHALLDPSVPLVSLIGSAGAGKTLVALAACLEQRSTFRQILLTRPLIPMGGTDMLGFIPGSTKEKLDPHMMAYYDNLGVLKVGEKAKEIEQFLQLEKIKIEALQHMRGRSLNRVIMIVDEAANCTRHEVKTLVSRMGTGSKLIMLGDIDQIDAPYLDKETNGLSNLVNKLKGEPLYAHVTLTHSERSELADLAVRAL